MPFRTALLFLAAWFGGLFGGRSASARDILKGPGVAQLREIADASNLHPAVRYRIRLEGGSDRQAALSAGVQNVSRTLELHGIRTALAKRVFRHAGRHEAKHVAYGFDAWFSSEILFLGRGTASPQSQAHRAVDALEILLNESHGCVAHLDAIEAAAVPRMIYTPSDLYYSTYQATDYGSTRVPLAWDTQGGSSNVVVQIIDSGVFGSGKGEHPDLQNIWTNAGEYGLNSYGCSDGHDDDANGFVDDCYGYNFADDSSNLEGDGSHGTHVAGTVGASTDNSIGIAGVAGGKGGTGGASLMISTVFGTTYTSGFAEALVYGADNGAHISCNSWGYTSAGVYDSSVLAAIDYAHDEGVYVVFAAGNDNDDGEWYPAFYSKAIAVASTDSADNTRSSFSNYGAWVDISAPGSEIYSTYYDADSASYGYALMSGTSMACPHVAGVLALVLSQVGNAISQADMLTCMALAAQNIDSVNGGYEGLLGAGLIDASAMIFGCDSMPTAQPIPKPTPGPTTTPQPTPEVTCSRISSNVNSVSGLNFWTITDYVSGIDSIADGGMDMYGKFIERSLQLPYHGHICVD